MTTYSFTRDVSRYPLDFAGCVESGQVFRWASEDSRVWRGVDGASVFEVCAVDGLLKVSSNTDQTVFEKLFRLDDPSDIEERLLALGPELAPYMAASPGYRLMRPSCRVETIFSFMCTPNNHVSRITKMVNTLAAYGEGHRFPSIERLADISEAELRAKGFGYRGATVPNLARIMVDRGGDSYLESITPLSYDELTKELVGLPGIGPKLADCIALFAFHRTEAVPVDTHIWQAATSIYFPEWRGTSLTAPKYRAIGDRIRDRFGSLAGWAQQFLFYGRLKRRV